MEVIIDTHLSEIVCLHNVLYWFRAGRGTGVMILEMNMEQELARLEQDPLFLVFVYLKNSYDTVDCGRLMMTLEGYGAGPHMCRLLAVSWEQQEVVIYQNRYHTLDFKENQGTTQGGLISLTLFNLIVDNVVRNWLSLVVEDQLVSQEVLVLVVGRCLGLFFVYNGVVGLWYPTWLQGALNVLIGIFHRYGLVANVAKYKSMT